ncbi:hypothetical protein CLV35_2172 [Motilibacter peucedani]|uniref:Uncharacterized protein n=1 Tax=Motilibacter peucedani TaxID=598650 RepID=A0A420XR24_9ACTN|nr:hypothetical protein [Motilibacter peucedani]RKS75695.1 hypothetical protein CLV35_2172 [Motilibacter peucedani]
MRRPDLRPLAVAALSLAALVPSTGASAAGGASVATRAAAGDLAAIRAATAAAQRSGFRAVERDPRGTEPGSQVTTYDAVRYAAHVVSTSVDGVEDRLEVRHVGVYYRLDAEDRPALRLMHRPGATHALDPDPRQTLAIADDEPTSQLGGLRQTDVRSVRRRVDGTTLLVLQRHSPADRLTLVVGRGGALARVVAAPTETSAWSASFSYGAHVGLPDRRRVVGLQRLLQAKAAPELGDEVAQAATCSAAYANAVADRQTRAVGPADLATGVAAVRRGVADLAIPLRFARTPDGWSIAATDPFTRVTHRSSVSLSDGTLVVVGGSSADPALVC